jgi:hypothetical protein
LDFYPALNPTDYLYLNGWGGSSPLQIDELRISDVARTQFNVVTSPAPEPATLALLGSALLGLGVVYLRRHRAKA